MTTRLDPVLAWLALAHLAVAGIGLVMLVFEAPAILGVHPAAKPIKFGVSIAIFLGTMAVLLPMLSIGPTGRAVLRWTLGITMVIEMVPIVVQALRGTTSHYNTGAVIDAAMWRLMFIAIVFALVAMIAVAVLATVRPLIGDEGPLSTVESTGWRAGLWVFQIATLSGLGMGGRGRHTVGGDDGGAGLPVVNWSRSHGDLRVSHFLALHALQVLPLIGIALSQLAIGPRLRVGVIVAVIAGYAAVTVWTYVTALAGRPVW